MLSVRLHLVFKSHEVYRSAALLKIQWYPCFLLFIILTVKHRTCIVFGSSLLCNSAISDYSRYSCTASGQCVELGLEQSPETFTWGLTPSHWISELRTQHWLSSAQQLELIPSADSLCFPYQWLYEPSVSSLTPADLLCFTYCRIQSSMFVEQILKHLH